MPKPVVMVVIATFFTALAQLSFVRAVPVVVKLDDVEKFPALEHTACIWNSYGVDPDSPLIVTLVVVAVVLVQADDEVGLYCIV